MYGGSLGAISTAGDWSDALLITDEDTGDPIDLTGVVVTFTVRPVPCGDPGGADDYDRPLGGIALSGGTATGEVTIPALGTIEWDFKAPLRLDPGEHRVGIVISREGDTLQLFLGTIAVERGF